MITRRRIRGTIKWGGAVVTVLLLIVWVGSAWYLIGFDYFPNYAVAADSGRLMIASYEPGANRGRLDPDFIPWLSHEPNPSMDWWFDRFVPTQRNASVTVKTTTMYIPIWAMAVAMGVSTLMIWRHDRKRPPGTCRKCGYSRTGLPADRACPECGTAAQSA